MIHTVNAPDHVVDFLAHSGSHTTGCMLSELASGLLRLLPAGSRSPGTALHT